MIINIYKLLIFIPIFSTSISIPPSVPLVYLLLPPSHLLIHLLLSFSIFLCFPFLHSSPPSISNSPFLLLLLLLNPFYIFILPTDVDMPNPDEKSVITYVSSLYDVFPEVPSVEQSVKDNVSQFDEKLSGFLNS